MKAIGSVYSPFGEYFSQKIEFTLYKGERVHTCQYVAVKHPEKTNTYIIYQVIEAPFRRKSLVQDEYLIRERRADKDPSRVTARATAIQIGYREGDEIVPYLYSIEPLTEVYEVSDEEIDSFINPSGDTITIGKAHPSLRVPVKFDLSRLLRQGCLVIGGVGTGKTTTMLTLLHAFLNAPTIFPRLLVIDWDGEFAIPNLNLATIKLKDLSVKEGSLAMDNFARKAFSLAGINWQKKEAKALYAVLKHLELSGKRSFNWDENTWMEILQCMDPPYQKYWAEKIVFKEKRGENLLNIINEYPLVRLDCSGLDWNTIIRDLACLFHQIYQEAKSNKHFYGLAIFIDEAHLFAPQRAYEAPADKHFYEHFMLPIIKLIATTGARSGIPLFLTTQRLSELDKTVSTQVGQNIIAHRVEDVDLERLKFIIGSVANIASQLPRGYALVKSMSLKVMTPLIVKIYRVLDPVSVEKDLLILWKRRKVECYGAGGT